MGCLKLNYNYDTDLKISWVNNYVRSEKTTLKIHSNYVYGFGGHEKDDEVAGQGNSYDFGARIYDPRLGRFLSIDPDFKQYPDWSPYVFALDNPIRLIDLAGRGPIDALKKANTAANSTANDYWKKSFNEDKTVVNEWGFILVEKQTVIKVGTSEEIKKEIIVKNIVKGDNGSTTLDRTVGKDETLIGELHTHPYSVSEGSHEGIAFSGGDIDVMRLNLKNDYTMLVEAGDRRFGMVITDEKKAEAFFKDKSRADIQKSWDDAFAGAKGTFQEKVKTAVTSVLGSDSGIGFYESDTKKEEFTEIKPVAPAPTE
jgi:RHS repeat-associated protein